LSGKVDKVEEKINGLQKEVTNLLGCLQGDVKAAPSVAVKNEAPAVNSPLTLSGPTVTVTCSRGKISAHTQLEHKP
jgi:hypothetical protein